jgi:cell division protein FtsW (lipid II flippase)
VSTVPLVTSRVPVREGAVRPSPRPYVTERPRERSRLSLMNPAWISVAAAAALTLLGVYTIDVALRAGGGGGVAGQALSQAVFASVGVIAAAAVCVPHYRWLGHLSWAAMTVSVGLLVFLLIPFVPETIVRPINGARGWIDLKVFRLQPAELAKLSFVLVVAQYLRFRTTHRRFLGLVPLGLIAMIPVGLITLEPDLGNALLFIPALFAMLVAAGARLRHLSISCCARRWRPPRRTRSCSRTRRRGSGRSSGKFRATARGRTTSTTSRSRPRP